MIIIIILNFEIEEDEIVEKLVFGSWERVVMARSPPQSFQIIWPYYQEFSATKKEIFYIPFFLGFLHESVSSKK